MKKQPTSEMKREYIEMVIRHSMVPGYRQKLDSRIINQYGWDFWEKLIYEVEGYPAESNPAGKDKVMVVWAKMNDSERFGMKFGMFPSWIQEYKLTHDEIVRLMGLKIGGKNINIDTKRNPSHNPLPVGIALAHKVSDYLAGRLALTRQNVADALYEITGGLPTRDDIIDIINIIESGYQIPRRNPGRSPALGLVIAGGLALMGYGIYDYIKK